MKKEKTKSTALSLATITQEDVPSVLKMIETKLKEFKKSSNANDFITDSVPEVNMPLKDFKSVSDLLKAYAGLQAKEKFFKEAAKELIPENTIKLPAYTPGGHSMSAWKNSFRQRIHELANAQKIAQLEKAKSTLEKRLSEDEKLKRDLASITKDLVGFELQ